MTRVSGRLLAESNGRIRFQQTHMLRRCDERHDRPLPFVMDHCAELLERYGEDSFPTKRIRSCGAAWVSGGAKTGRFGLIADDVASQPSGRDLAFRLTILESNGRFCSIGAR